MGFTVTTHYRFLHNFILLTKCMALSEWWSVLDQGYNHQGSVGICPNYYLFPSSLQVGLFLVILSAHSSCTAHPMQCMLIILILEEWTEKTETQ